MIFLYRDLVRRKEKLNAYNLVQLNKFCWGFFKLKTLIMRKIKERNEYHGPLKLWTATLVGADAKIA